MNNKPEMIEGPEAFRRFRDATKAILAVPHSEIKKRLDAHREQPRRIRTSADLSGRLNPPPSASLPLRTARNLAPAPLPSSCRLAQHRSAAFQRFVA
jgi:hypothetical protein